MNQINCPVCKKLGKEISVDNIEDEHFPPEYGRLAKEPETDDAVLRCPLCGQAYRYYRNYDNDVYNLFDYSQITQIDEAKVSEIKASVKKWEEYLRQEVRKFRRKARRTHRTLLDGLTPDQKRVYDYLIEKTFDGSHFSSMAGDLSFTETNLLAVLDSLEKTGIVFRQVNLPLSAGEHGFQEEIQVEDKLPYTIFKIRT